MKDSNQLAEHIAEVVQKEVKQHSGIYVSDVLRNQRQVVEDLMLNANLSLRRISIVANQPLYELMTVDEVMAELTPDACQCIVDGKALNKCS